MELSEREKWFRSVKPLLKPVMVFGSVTLLLALLAVFILGEWLDVMVVAWLELFCTVVGICCFVILTNRILFSETPELFYLPAIVFTALGIGLVIWIGSTPNDGGLSFIFFTIPFSLLALVIGVGMFIHGNKEYRRLSE